MPRMKRIPQHLLSLMADSVSDDDRDEMAIPSYQHRNPLLRWMAWRRLEVVAEFFRESCGKINDGAAHTVMDFGCGTGVLFDESSQVADQVYGVDIVLDPARLLVDAWGLEKVVLLTPAEAEKKLPPQSIDTIIAAEVLEHIEPLDDTLAFFRDRLRPGGTLLVSLPTESLLYRFGRRLAGFEGHYHQSNAASIHRQILGAGFEQLRMQKIPAPGPLAIYWVVEYR
jgi:predicted TPR repeat methyltransferase